MKIFTFKTAFLLCLLAIIPNLSVLAHVNSVSIATDEPQQFMLIDNKMSFTVEQIDFESIKVESLEFTEEYIKPKITRTEDGKIVTIDFTECAEGSYLVTGTRGDLVLEYLVMYKK